MNPCVGCVEKGLTEPCWTNEPNLVCCDCAFPTPRDRQRKLGELEWALAQAQESLRDRFAMAALTGILARSDNDVSGEKVILLHVAQAFAFADEALRQRKAT